MHSENDRLIPALWKTICNQTDERTLWILDGLDEVSGERNTSGTELTELFKGFLNRHNVIITSRPYALNLPALNPFDIIGNSLISPRPSAGISKEKLWMIRILQKRLWNVSREIGLSRGWFRFQFSWMHYATAGIKTLLLEMYRRP